MTVTRLAYVSGTRIAKRKDKTGFRAELETYSPAVQIYCGAYLSTLLLSFRAIFFKNFLLQYSYRLRTR